MPPKFGSICENKKLIFNSCLKFPEDGRGGWLDPTSTGSQKEKKGKISSENSLLTQHGKISTHQVTYAPGSNHPDGAMPKIVP